MYRNGNSNRWAHDENGPVVYRFPSLPEEFSAGQGTASSDKKGCDIGFENQSAEPMFLSLFDNGQEKASETENSEGDVQARLAQTRQQAYQEGFEEGRRAGGEGEKERLKETLKSLEAAVDGIERAKVELYRDAEMQAVELGLRIARRIICREVSLDRDMICRVLREGLKKVRDQKEIHVKMNPEDLRSVEEGDPGLVRPAGTHGKVTLEAGEGICRGECVIETDFGVIDARIESQIQTIEDALRRMLQEGSVTG